MAQWACAACSAAYAVGAPCCPQCGSTDRAEDRVLNLPMIRVACAWDGCRYEDLERDVRLRPVGVGLVEMPTLLCAGCGRIPLVTRQWSTTPEQEDDTVPKITVHGGASDATNEQPATPAPGEEESSPGTSSSTSSAKEPSSPEPSEKPAPSRARKTGNRSGRARTGASTAPSTDGDQTEPSSDKASE